MNLHEKEQIRDGAIEDYRRRKENGGIKLHERRQIKEMTARRAIRNYRMEKMIVGGIGLLLGLLVAVYSRLT